MLKRSGDRKVANRVTKSGKVGMKNAFGLPAGNTQSCPGATSFCSKICYAGKLEKIFKSTKVSLVHNFTDLVYADYLGGVDAMVDLLDEMIIAFVKQCDKFNSPKYFRIHWDGDFFNTNYAKAWAIVCRAHKDVKFWVYTRTFEALPILTGIPNLGVFISADPVNLGVARKLSKVYNTPIAYVDDTMFENPGLEGKTYKCPEGRSLPLITEKGSACMRCGVCPNVRGNVLFSTAV